MSHYLNIRTPDSFENIDAELKFLQYMAMAALQRMEDLGAGLYTCPRAKTYFASKPEVPVVVQRVEPGVYSQITDRFMGLGLAPFHLETDEIVPIHGGVLQQVVDDLEFFLRPETHDKMDTLKMLWKHAALLYGPPGTGKTSIIYLLIEQLVKMGCVVVVQPDVCYMAQVVDLVRRNPKDRLEQRPVGFIIEEVDQIIDYEEETLLQFLDGPDSRPGTFVVATTNDIDSIPDRIRYRPSRFPSVIEVGYPTVSERTQLLEAKIPQHLHDKFDLEAVARETGNVSIDHVKHVIIRMYVYNEDRRTAIKNSGFKTENTEMTVEAKKEKVVTLQEELAELEKQIKETEAKESAQSAAEAAAANNDSCQESA